MGRRDALASVRAARAAPAPPHRHHRPRPPQPRLLGHAIPREAQSVEAVVAGIDVYSCMSQFAVDFLARDYGRTDGVVAPGGVDLDAFQPAAAREARPTLLLSGAFTEPRKGGATVLEPRCR